MGYRKKSRRLAAVLARLRRRAGHKSLRSAARAIQAETGVALGHTCLSRWERDREQPSFQSLLTFLDGLGFDLKTLQDELDRADGEEAPLPPSAEEVQKAEEEALRQERELVARMERHVEELLEKASDPARRTKEPGSG